MKTMEHRLLCILMELFIQTKGHAIIHTIGEQVLLPCEAISPHTRWFWFPLNPRCANISGSSVEIIWNHTTHEVTPFRFNPRLIYYPPRTLLLRNLVMSDAGTYICRLPNGSETRTVLQVSPGCHNNLRVSSEWNGSSSMKLTCHHCDSLGTEDSFRWMLNSKRLGNPRWAKKSNRGSTITIYPIRQVVWGHWECHSLANSSWVSEICLSPLTEKKDTGFKREEDTGTGTTRITHEDFPSAKPTSLAASHWSHPPATKTTDAPSTGHTRKGIPVWIWAVTVLLVVLVIIPAVLGAAVWLWKRKADRKCRESRERTDHPFLRYDPRKKKGLMKRESLHERSASLHYAQLQHLQKKSSTVQTPDNTTVYAVIV